MKSHFTDFNCNFLKYLVRWYLAGNWFLMFFGLSGVTHEYGVRTLLAADRDTDDPSELLFTRYIASILQEKCVACHGGKPDEIEGDLDLRSLDTLMAGGDSGEPGIISGMPESSAIYLAATRNSDLFSAMPPKDSEQLTETQLIHLRDWIASGAKWPSRAQQQAIRKKYADQWSANDGVTVVTSGGLLPEWTHRKYDPAGLWAYQAASAVHLAKDARQPIDQLIEELIPKGLQLAAPAPRRELIRRASFDLIGLPPTPEQVDEFVNDQRSDQEAFAAVLDRLLASPHYGERMAQHWLDVVRYADSSGFANDYERGNAWRYRDYVIRSFNDDKPYDRFIKEQIAGDEIMSDNPEGVIAVGFLRMGPWELTGMEVQRIARQRFLDDVTNSVGETFLGQSLQCARCHDHKFDPIPTQDYYRIQAVFATTQLAERPAAFISPENTSGFEERDFLEQKRDAYVATQQQLQRVLQQNSIVWFEQRLSAADKDEVEKWASLQSRWERAIENAVLQKQANPFNAARNGLMKQGVPESDLPPQFIGFTPQQYGLQRVANKGMERLRWEMERYDPFAHSVYNGHTPSLVRVEAPLRMPTDPTEGTLEASCVRSGGDPFSVGQSVSPGTLSVIDPLLPGAIPSTIDQRRTRLAEWIADARNPLTTRVIVNRVWQWHFGTAIAGNPNNFGSTGKRPTHPRLLDYLATALVDGGWSIKKLHRAIMLSEAYRRSSSHPNPQLLDELDPQRTSWAVFQPRRMSAEELRDSMLAATGELNPILGGIPCRPEINREVALQPRQVMGTFAAAWEPNPKPSQRHRRSIYVLKLRGVMHPMLEVFNSPAPDFSCERRDSSTVTPQVFSLFNSEDTYSRALALARRAWSEAESTQEDQERSSLRRCFELVLNRTPSPDEITMLLAHWKTLVSKLPAVAPECPAMPTRIQREAVEENTGERFVFDELLPASAHFEPDLRAVDLDRQLRALADICLVLFNSNEFVYIY